LQVKVKGGDNVQVILGAIGPFWEKCHRPILGKMGAGASSAERGLFFLCGKPDDFSGTFTKFGHETYFGIPSRNPVRHQKNFHFSGHFPPKSEIGQTGTSLRAGYRSWDALQRDTVYSML